MEKSQFLARITTVVTSVLFLMLCLLAAHNSALEYDEADFAAVAKNLSLGLGYATSYKTFIHFDPGITTGPGLLLPMAALIKLLGNQYWVPGATNAVISSGIFGLFFCFLLRTSDWNPLGSAGRLALIFSMPLFLSLCLGMGIIGFFSVGLGETGAAGFVLLGQLVLAHATVHPNKRRTHVLSAYGGLLLGLSLCFKLIVLLQIVPTLLLFPLIVYWKNSWHRAVQCFALSAVTCALPSLIFCLVAAPYLDRSDQASFFVSKGSGLNHLGFNFFDQIDYFFYNFCKNTGIILSTLTDWFAACFLAVVLIGSWTGLFYSLKKRLLFPAASSEASAPDLTFIIFLLYVLAGACGGFGWWLFFSNLGWIRHLLPTLLGALVFVSLSPVIVPVRFSSTIFWCQIVGILSLLASYQTRFDGVPAGYPFPASDGAIMTTYTGLRLEPSARVADQVALTNYLADLLRNDPKAHLYGCGGWAVRDAEYLLPTTGNFQDIYSQDFVDHPAPRYNRYFVIDLKYWTAWRDAASLEANEVWCKQSNLLYSKGDYFVFQCP